MNKLFPAWSDGLRKLLIDRGDGSHAERVEAYPPVKLMTDEDGDYARIRVDVAQTGFFAGREAYTYYKFTIPTANYIVIKAVSPVDTILQMFAAELFQASVRIELVVDGTEGGTFSTSLPINVTNLMSTASGYTPQVTMSTGGTHTGGTVRNAYELDSGTQPSKLSSESASNDLPYGFPAGTYYIRIVNTDGAEAIGYFRARWEERP